MFHWKCFCCFFFSLQLLNPGCLNVKKVAVIYQQALTQFLSKRNSPLTCSMFHDLFKRFPVSAAGCVLCCLLLAPKNDYNSRESRERNFSALLQTSEITVQFPWIFTCSDSVFIATLQEARILFMVWTGILHAESRRTASSLKHSLRSSNVLPVFKTTWMSKVCTKAEQVTLFEEPV